MFLGCSAERLRALKPNVEGLTFEEWLCAADPSKGAGLLPYPKMAHLRQQYPKEVKAWLAGEDPTDWRAALPRPEEPKPYALRAGPFSGGRGARAVPEAVVERLRAIPAKNLVGNIYYEPAGHLPRAVLDVTPWSYAHVMGAWGNTEAEAAENLKLILIDDLEGTGLYHSRAYQPHIHGYELEHVLLPYWEKRT